MSMYPEVMCIPMREELTRLGVEELKTADAVDQALKNPGTALIVVNSICGCAAGRMRPAVRMALQNGAKPDQRLLCFRGPGERSDRACTELLHRDMRRPRLRLHSSATGSWCTLCSAAISSREKPRRLRPS